MLARIQDKISDFARKYLYAYPAGTPFAWALIVVGKVALVGSAVALTIAVLMVASACPWISIPLLVFLGTVIASWKS